MSAYDDAVAYLDAEVHPRCDYDIYSDMRDIVDEMEAENAKLRELLAISIRCHNFLCDGCSLIEHGWCVYEERAAELGIEVEK